MPDLKALLDAATAELAAAGVETARQDAGLLIGHALGHDRGWVLTHLEHEPEPAVASRIAALLARRADREPVSRILGHREFWSLDFTLDPATLDPRPDSETAVEVALEHLQPADRPWRVLDLGTGTGCLLLAVLSERPQATGVGVDIAPAAARTARANAIRLGLGSRAAFVVADWAIALAEQFDLVLSNPPYIAAGELAHLEPEVTRWDPRSALDGGPDGLDAYRALLPQLPGLLAPGGRAVLEIGCDQAEAVAGLARRYNLPTPWIRADLAGKARCVIMAVEGGGTEKDLGEASGAR